MMKTTDMLLLMRGIEKFYDRCMEDIRNSYGLSQIEIRIIGFLHNNPGKDTAADICYLRMLPKGNVSQGVELLMNKGFLSRTPDERDRRKIHLGLTDRAGDIVREIDKAKVHYEEILLAGIPAESLSVYNMVNEQIMENVFKGLERRKRDGE